MTQVRLELLGGKQILFLRLRRSWIDGVGIEDIDRKSTVHFNRLGGLILIEKDPPTKASYPWLAWLVKHRIAPDR
jgi:hypothetical protein